MNFFNYSIHFKHKDIYYRYLNSYCGELSFQQFKNYYTPIIPITNSSITDVLIQEYEKSGVPAQRHIEGSPQYRYELSANCFVNCFGTMSPDLQYDIINTICVPVDTRGRSLATIYYVGQSNGEEICLYPMECQQLVLNVLYRDEIIIKKYVNTSSDAFDKFFKLVKLLADKPSEYRIFFSFPLTQWELEICDRGRLLPGELVDFLSTYELHKPTKQRSFIWDDCTKLIQTTNTNENVVLLKVFDSVVDDPYSYVIQAQNGNVYFVDEAGCDKQGVQIIHSIDRPLVDFSQPVVDDQGVQFTYIGKLEGKEEHVVYCGYSSSFIIVNQFGQELNETGKIIHSTQRIYN